MGTLSGLGWGRELGNPDRPRTLRLASDGRGCSYDSGDAVSGVEFVKWTPLDLTSEEIDGGGILACTDDVGCIV